MEGEEQLYVLWIQTSQALQFETLSPTYVVCKDAEAAVVSCGVGDLRHHIRGVGTDLIAATLSQHLVDRLGCGADSLTHLSIARSEDKWRPTWQGFIGGWYTDCLEGIGY